MSLVTDMKYRLQNSKRRIDTMTVQMADPIQRTRILNLDYIALNLKLLGFWGFRLQICYFRSANLNVAPQTPRVKFHVTLSTLKIPQTSYWIYYYEIYNLDFVFVTRDPQNSPSVKFHSIFSTLKDSYRPY